MRASLAITAQRDGSVGVVQSNPWTVALPNAACLVSNGRSEQTQSHDGWIFLPPWWPPAKTKSPETSQRGKYVTASERNEGFHFIDFFSNVLFFGQHKIVLHVCRFLINKMEQDKKKSEFFFIKFYYFLVRFVLSGLN